MTHLHTMGRRSGLGNAQRAASVGCEDRLACCGSPRRALLGGGPAVVPRGLLDPTMLAFAVAPVGLVVSLGWRLRGRRRPHPDVDVARPGAPQVPSGMTTAVVSDVTARVPPGITAGVVSEVITQVPSDVIGARSGRWAIAGLIVGLVAVAVLVAVVGLDLVAEVLSEYRLGWLGVAVALQGLVHVGMSRVYRVVFGLTGGRLTHRDALTISLKAYACMQMLPAGGIVGGAYAARQLTRRGADHVAAGTTVVVFGLVSMGTLALLLSVGTIVSALVTGTGGTYAAVSLTMACLFLAGILLVHLSLSRPRWRREVGTQVARLHWRGRAPFANVIDSLERHRDLLRRPRAIVPAVLWSALAWTSGITMFAVLVHAAGGTSITAILVSFAVAHLLNGLPLTPGGIGLVELGMAGTLIALGTDPAVASVAVVSYRLVASWLPIGVALATAGLSARSVMDAPEVAR